jgi:hypothetical protein
MSTFTDLARKLRPYIVKAAQSLSDADALRAAPLYAPWKPDTKYAKDYKVNREGRVYKANQPHTSQNGWEPENAPALWTEINEASKGTIDDPIPYNNNMALENGLYYAQYGVTYKCIRDSVVPVYNDLSALVGLYVEAI